MARLRRRSASAFQHRLILRLSLHLLQTLIDLRLVGLDLAFGGFLQNEPLMHQVAPHVGTETLEQLAAQFAGENRLPIDASGHLPVGPHLLSAKPVTKSETATGNRRQAQQTKTSRHRRVF